MTRKSSGEIFRAGQGRGANPKGDIWWGGTGDPHLQAAEEGPDAEYKSPMHRASCRTGRSSRQGQSGGRTVGIYAGALGFGYNTELLAKKGLPEPKCWADLLKPEFKDEVQIANPNSSGTAYTVLATIVQIMGEDKALRAISRRCTRTSTSTPSPARRRSRRWPGARPRSASSSCTTR